jgi:hypothetical protein
MYSKQTTGKRLNVQGLECYIPPEGYVYNITNGNLEHRGIWQRSDIPIEQYWERTPLPKWYKVISKQQEDYEKKMKEGDKPFYDEKLDEYIKTEWDRRLNGFWFMNYNPSTQASEPVYITGLHYMFIQWWQIDIGYPKFRMPDLDYFYFLQYCLEDPDSLGMIEITKRRFGKTFRAGLFLYEYVTRTKNTNAGVQSKTGLDSKKLFLKAVVAPFKRLPKFFRPEYDTSLGITPKTEIRFQHTNLRGKAAESLLDKDELGSMIDHQSADIVAYDGQKLHRYVGDETAKTLECNVYDRHNVIRYCLLDDEGKIIGKALYCTTVEKLETEKAGVQEAFRQLWDDSDQNNRKENGRTPSGLYRFFMTADRGRYIDIYGYPDEPKTVTEILSDRQSVAHNIRALFSLIHKEARTVDEAFSADADKCLFNTDKLVSRRSLLSYHKELLETGNFMWDNGIRDTKVIWCPDINGRWQVIKEFMYKFLEKNDKGEYKYANATEKRGGLFIPKNDWQFGGAVDPYDHDTVDDNRRSQAGSLVKQKNNFDNFGDKFNWCDVCKYIARPVTAELMYEDMVMQFFFFSCRMLPETQKPGIMRYFRNRGYAAFLMILPGYTEPGIPSTPENKQIGCEFVEYDVETRIDKYYFTDVIDDLLNLDIKKTQKYDLGMAKLWTEVACMNKLYERRQDNRVVDISTIFKHYKIKSA